MQEPANIWNYFYQNFEWIDPEQNKESKNVALCILSMWKMI